VNLSVCARFSLLRSCGRLLLCPSETLSSESTMSGGKYISASCCCLTARFRLIALLILCVFSHSTIASHLGFQIVSLACVVINLSNFENVWFACLVDLLGSCLSQTALYDRFYKCWCYTCAQVIKLHKVTMIYEYVDIIHCCVAICDIVELSKRVL